MACGPWGFLDWGAGKEIEASASEAPGRKGRILRTLDMIPQPPTACKPAAAAIASGRACPVAGKPLSRKTVPSRRIAPSGERLPRKPFGAAARLPREEGLMSVAERG